MSTSLRRMGAVFGTLLLTACAEQAGPLSSERPTPVPLANLAQLDCTVSTRDRTLSCSSPSRSGDARSLIVGGQGSYVFLQASNHSFTPGNNVYSFDVTVQNLIGQALGTTDGTTLDTAGVRVFFDEEPVATDGVIAPITVLNEAGTDLFTRAGQLYYQYDEMLPTNATSSAQTWEFEVDPGTTRFAFRVYVAAQVQFPDGWVDLTPGADTLLVGATNQLAATVRSVVGNPLAGETITWGTSNPDVATVDANGVLTTVAPGIASISATSGVRSAQTTVMVCPDLAVGGVYTGVMPLAANLCFAGGATGAEYTYMPVNLSDASRLSLSVTGSGITGVTGPPSPAMMPGASMLRQVSDAELEARDDWHIRHLEDQMRQVRDLMGRPSARVTRAVRPNGPRGLITKGPAIAVGDLMTLNTASGCSGTRDDQIGRVRSIGQHIIIVADTMNPAGGFTTAQYDSIAAEFDTLAYPVNVNNFGAPTDLDGNGRVVAFYTRAVNQLSPPASSSIVSGYVNARDLFSSAASSCTRSNEGEIFYMLVPDPTGAVNSNVRTVSLVRGGTVATLGHEFQHLINASRRIYVNEVAGYETVWLNEGLSHVVEELMFYRASVGLAPRGNIQLSTLTSGPSASRRVAAYNTYSNQNFTRLRSWLQRPDTTGPLRANDVLATRGATWAFLRYAADRAGGDEAQFWYSLVNSQTSGTANLQAVIGTDPQGWVRDWIAAMYADDAVAGVAAAYTNPSWNFRSVYGGLGGFPLGTRPLTNGTALTLSYAPGGSTAYTRFGVPANGFAGVTALSAGVPPTSPYALIVMRTK